jgi:ankyrin repeat protein
MEKDKLWRISKNQIKVKQVDQDLLNAAYFGNERLVRKYIKEGGDINFMEERDGWQGIHYAARWGIVSMLLSYLRAGADVDTKTKNKETSLHKCARWCTKDCAIILLEKGANSKIKNSDGNIASELTNDPEMKFLLDNYEEYKKIQLERGVDDMKLIFTKHKKVVKSIVAEYIKSKPVIDEYNYTAEMLKPFSFKKTIANKHIKDK